MSSGFCIMTISPKAESQSSLCVKSSMRSTKYVTSKS